MPSLSQLAILATAAFAAFSSAAPVVTSKRDLVPLPAILSQLASDLAPVTSLLSSINLANATAEVVTPITDELQSILSGVVPEIEALAGNPVSTILSTVDGVLSVADAAQLVATPINLVSGALGNVLAVVENSPAVAIITPLLGDVSGVVGTVLTDISPLVDGLLTAAAPLIEDVVGTLDNLGLGPVIATIGPLAGLLEGL
ncbi:hypothetical protein DFH07DRAFT_938313 [Mycena maculata]|uniref:Uncharacterized protein n=1 Tax=Mycena maculata TaxID=230809 RepID=A0AAD7JPR7_9AGAR|nr:hypothetical protein DFH07DRAFT_938313 [Mycena maculata]